MTGAPVMSPCSFPNAISEPVNVMRPKNTSKPSAPAVIRSSSPACMPVLELGDTYQRRRQTAESSARARFAPASWSSG